MARFPNASDASYSIAETMSSVEQAFKARFEGKSPIDLLHLNIPETTLQGPRFHEVEEVPNVHKIPFLGFWWGLSAETSG